MNASMCYKVDQSEHRLHCVLLILNKSMEDTCVEEGAAAGLTYTCKTYLLH